LKLFKKLIVIPELSSFPEKKCKDDEKKNKKNKEDINLL